MPESYVARIRMARAKNREDLPDDLLDEGRADARYAKSVFVYARSEAASDWYIHHDLGGKPACEFIDSSGGRVHGSVTYPSEFVVHAHFSSPFSGEARLRQ